MKLTGPKKREMQIRGVLFACHVEADIGEAPDGCVLDYGCPLDCDHAHNTSGWIRKDRESCAFWLPLTSA